MANEKFYVTQEGYNDLVNEHENLVHKVRQEVIVELQEARAQGDLSENADYDAAREHQAQVEGRIRELEAMIKNAEIISEADNAEDKKKKSVVKLGSTVRILDLSDNEIKDISALKFTTKIEILEVANNSIGDISVLKDLKILTKLNEYLSVIWSNT